MLRQPCRGIALAMPTKKFQRRMEDFVCDKCGTSVTGDGYTDHCPTCLWSKHVDINPGDRASVCLGLMEPTRIEGGTDAYSILYTCTRCSHTHRVKAHKQDSSDAIINLAHHAAKKDSYIIGPHRH